MSLLALIKYLPDLIEIFLAVKKLSDEAEQKRQIEQDLQLIAKAFHDKDASALNDIFNKLPDSKEAKP